MNSKNIKKPIKMLLILLLGTFVLNTEIEAIGKREKVSKNPFKNFGKSIKNLFFNENKKEEKGNKENASKRLHEKQEKSVKPASPEQDKNTASNKKKTKKRKTTTSKKQYKKKQNLPKSQIHSLLNVQSSTLTNSNLRKHNTNVQSGTIFKDMFKMTKTPSKEDKQKNKISLINQKIVL